jgi:integrase
MTSPRPSIPDTVAELTVVATSPVLQARQLHPGTDPASLSRFGDPVWDLFPALPDRHSTNQRIHWDTYPAAFRHLCKLYVFALLNVIEHAPRLPYARTEVPSVKTIWADLGHLRAFLDWLADHGIDNVGDVTMTDLDHYLRHVTDQPATSTTRKRKALLAVQRLHAYRRVLPAHCRLPAAPPWGGASAAELADDPDPRRAENRTPRIHPDAMHPLLSAALLATDTIAADLLPLASRLVTLRAHALRLEADTGEHPRKPISRWHGAQNQLARVLAALAERGQPLPGVHDGQATIIDITGLSVAGHIDRELLGKQPCHDILARCDLPISKDLLRATRFTAVQSQPWRDHPVEATEMLTLIRHLTTACFLVIAYLSGIRTGEALNLKRGCVTRDATLGLIFMSGHQLKARPDRRERSPKTIPWVINEHAAKAITVLEDLSPSAMLFPPGKFGSPEWLASTRCRTTGAINDDIRAFIDWFNTAIAAPTGHPAIGADQHGTITASRLRRTLAWHIVRRPGGTIAAATQYGHLRTQITHGYAGHAGSGFLDEISLEEFLLRAERLHDDHQRLQTGEHVSGPAANNYRQRVTAGHTFAGLTITTPAQANTALANPTLQIHHGAMLTCVWRPETAACQDTADNTDRNGPAWPRCRLSCTNIAYTDRDIAAVQRHVHALRADLAAPGIPEPLHDRIQQRLTEHERVLTTHQASKTGRADDKAVGSDA